MCAAFRLFTDNLIKVAHHILLGPSLFFPSGKLHIRGDWKGGEKKKTNQQNPEQPQTLLHFPDAKTTPWH